MCYTNESVQKPILLGSSPGMLYGFGHGIYFVQRKYGQIYC